MTRALRYALVFPDTVEDAARTLIGRCGVAELNALTVLLEEHLEGKPARASLRACRYALRAMGEAAAVLKPHHREVLRQVLARSTSVRLRKEAAGVLGSGSTAEDIEALERALARDPAWTVRAAALSELGRREAIAVAGDDPHWRVRMALVRTLEDWARDEPERVQAVLRAISHDEAPRSRGVWAYLARWRLEEAEHSGALEDVLAHAGDPAEAEAIEACAIYDPDPPALRRRLDEAETSDLQAIEVELTALLSSEDKGIRSRVRRFLRRHAGEEALYVLLERLNEPRTPHLVNEGLQGILEKLDADRSESLSRFVLRAPESGGFALRWAATRVGEVYPASALEVEPEAYARYQALKGSRDEGKARPIQAARERMSREEAEALWARAEEVEDWHLLERAARRLRRRLDEIAPEPEPFAPRPELPDFTLEPASGGYALHENRAVLPRHTGFEDDPAMGSAEMAISRMGISGHYGLPEEGFVRALEAGVNLFFWEPNYGSMTRFMSALPGSNKRSLVLMSGSYQARPEQVIEDLERALGMLGVEQLGLFMVFWVRSADRIRDDLVAALQDARRAGKLAAFGLSTHQRGLALGAMERGFRVVMARHSAAHRNVERDVLPSAVERDVGIITFSNLCYGRMLEDPLEGLWAPSPADCYRYSLSHPGVRACLSAPATVTQLEHNLSALDAPEMSAAELERMRTFGDRVYRENSIFARCIRFR